MFVVEDILDTTYPDLAKKKLIGSSIKKILSKLLHEDDCKAFVEAYSELKGIEFVEQVLDFFNFSYTVSDRDRENIPSTGRLVIIANHPIGTLDGLALIKLVHEIRPDVKAVANELLSMVEPLHPCLLPVRIIAGKASSGQVRSIMASLAREEAVIMFPAGEVSRAAPMGVRDGKWQKGFLSIAERTASPVLPVHIKGKNSPQFYTASVLYKPLSTAMLVSEMFKQKNKQINFKVGEIIPFSSYHGMSLRDEDKVKLFKKHLYRVGKKKKPVFITERAIALPERKSDLKKNLQEGCLLGKTPDGKQIYLYSSAESSPLLREIGRLREVTFRSVEEGTGKRRDNDSFDLYYQHLVLWDEDDLEIVGAYRFVDSARVIKEKGIKGLYSGTLFSLSPDTHQFLEQGLELGRSFVQSRYWGKRSLDYLWYGIGAFLSRNPEYRYLFGPVSLSSNMPKEAKDLLIYFYKLYFSSDESERCSKNPFNFSQSIATIAREFKGDNYREDFKHLKALLANMGTTIPTLYKQYIELCEPGGARFIDFNIDPDFNNCVDGLVVLDMSKLKEKKRKRYVAASIL